MTKLKFIFFIILIFTQLSYAASLDGLSKAYIDFIQAEVSNSYIAKDSTVAPKYRADAVKPFEIGYIEIPIERLNTEISSVSEEILKQHFFVENSNNKLIRFFIHPDSEHLYKPLIKEVGGYKGFYSALATASTRTVLAWDPTRPDAKPVFIKLSLAQTQDRLGRIIPGWEVRRSVQLTETANNDIKLEKSNPNKVALIPEVAGAYVKSQENLKFFVDSDQGQVSEHGYILRDASFIENNKTRLVVPMFWLFSKGKNGKPPIIEAWEKSTYYTNKTDKQVTSFNYFVMDFFINPFIKQNLPLMIKQGIVPQIHGQNVVLVLDPKTLKLEKILHRDIGSMKADYRLRWINGLPINNLKSELADKDFGLSWGADQIEKYHLSYLHDWVFYYGYLKDIQKFIPSFNPSTTRSMLKKILNKELASLLKTNNQTMPANEQIKMYIENNFPDYKNTLLQTHENQSLNQVKDYLLERSRKSQVVTLPESWFFSLNSKFKKELEEKNYVSTNYGTIFKSSLLSEDSNSSLKIAFDENKQVKFFNKQSLKMCIHLF